VESPPHGNGRGRPPTHTPALLSSHTLSLSLSILFVLGTWAKEEESSISGRETKEVSSAAANSGVAELSELGKMRGLLEDAKVLRRNNLLTYHRRAQSQRGPSRTLWRS